MKLRPSAAWLVTGVLLIAASGAQAGCEWALWAYGANRVGVEVVRDLQMVFPTLDECRAFGAGWAEHMALAIRNHQVSDPDLAWSWSCIRIPEPLFDRGGRHPVPHD